VRLGRSAAGQRDEGVGGLADVRAQDLRAGELEYEAAAEAISVIGRIYGGVAGSFYLSRHMRDLEKEAQDQQEQIAKLDAFLGPEELRGPPTPEVPYDALSGFAFNQPMSPFRSSAGRVFLDTIRYHWFASSEIGSKSLRMSYWRA